MALRCLTRTKFIPTATSPSLCARAFATTSGGNRGDTSMQVSKGQQNANLPGVRGRHRGRRDFLSPIDDFAFPRVFDPFPSLTRNFDMMRNSLFRDLSDIVGPGALSIDTDALSVNVDFHEEKDKYVVTAEVPGVPKDGIKVELSNNVLTLRGEKNEEKSEEDKDRQVWRRERRYGSFTRSFELPEDINADAVRANYDSGVLRIEVPKSERAKEQTKNITVE